MLRLAIILIFYSLVLSSCKRDHKTSVSAEEIIELHQKAATSEADSSYIYLNRAEKLMTQAPSVVSDSLKAETNYLLGLYFQSQSQLDSAAVYFHHTIDFAQQPLTEREGNYFFSAWSTYNDLGLYGDCFTISQKFKSLIDPKKDSRQLSWAYFWEQSTYEKMGDFQKALEVNKLRVAHTRVLDTASLTNALVSQAQLNYFNRGDKKTAFAILESLLGSEKKLSDSDMLQVAEQYGIYQYYEGRYKVALIYYLESLKAAKKEIKGFSELGPDNLANCYSNIAEVYMDLKQYKKARKYLDSVRLLGIPNLDRAKQRALLDYELRYAVETDKNTRETSLVMNEIYTHQEEIYRQNSKNELLELTKTNARQQVLLEEKQAAEIENLKLQTRWIVLLVSFILLTLVALLVFSRRKLRFEKERLQLQQRLFRSQMNPHFTYNTLYAIQNEIKKNPKSAENYLVKFSRLLRLVLENSINNYVQLGKELEAIRKYLDLQLMHTPSKFSYEIILIDLEEGELVFVPPMLLQPIIENSIEHGFSGIDYPGVLTITLTLMDKFVHCSIEDNGKGLNEGTNSEKQSTSTKLISDFLKKHTKKSVEIINKDNVKMKGKGLLVRFLIPYKLTENA